MTCPNMSKPSKAPNHATKAFGVIRRRLRRGTGERVTMDDLFSTTVEAVVRLVESVAVFHLFV